MAKNDTTILLVGLGAVVLVGVAAVALSRSATAAVAPIGGKLNDAMWGRLKTIAAQVGADPEHLAAVIQFESKFNPAAVNPGSGASGLIQFMPKTAQALGTTVEAIRRMSALEQIPLVERYFVQTAAGRKLDTLQSVAMAVFYPRYMFVSPSTPFPADVQAANTLRLRDGSLLVIRTPADYLGLVAKASQGVGAPPPPDAPQPVLATTEAAPTKKPDVEPAWYSPVVATQRVQQAAAEAQQAVTQRDAQLQQAATERVQQATTQARQTAASASDALSDRATSAYQSVRDWWYGDGAEGIVVLGEIDKPRIRKRTAA